MQEDTYNNRDFETTVLQIAEYLGLDTTRDGLTTTDVVEAVRDLDDKHRLSLAKARKASHNKAITKAMDLCEDNEGMREALEKLIRN